MIHVQHLAKSFRLGRGKRFEAVGDVTFNVDDGEVFGLLGPNGAGKTTTLRMLSTVLRPDSGTATVDGFDIRHQKAEVRRRLGILVENAGLYVHLTARECLRYAGNLHGLGGEALEAEIAHIAEALGMSSFLDRRTQGFSKGMTRKVVIGMALVHAPRNIILDEPTAGLDVVSTRLVREMILRFKAEGRCVILSTHLMSEVERLCDRVGIIHRGQIRAIGSVPELLTQHDAPDLETAFVRAIGERALIDEALREAVGK
jgi:sodium transport system ATP-binding protein